MVKQTIVVFCFEKKYIIERIFPKLSVYQIKAFFEVGLKAFYSLKQPYKLKLLVLFQYNCILIKQEQKICFVSSIIINSTKKTKYRNFIINFRHYEICISIGNVIIL